MSLLGFLAFVIAVCAIWLLYKQQYGFEEAFRHAAFNIVSVVTTTGYATLDYSLWGNVAIGVFFGLLFVGGCTGSTSGGMKIFRFEVMALMLYGQFRRLITRMGYFLTVTLIVHCPMMSSVPSWCSSHSILSAIAR